jgi:hypothetical protein
LQQQGATSTSSTQQKTANASKSPGVSYTLVAASLDTARIVSNKAGLNFNPEFDSISRSLSKKGLYLDGGLWPLLSTAKQQAVYDFTLDMGKLADTYRIESSYLAKGLADSENAANDINALKLFMDDAAKLMASSLQKSWNDFDNQYQISKETARVTNAEQIAGANRTFMGDFAQGVSERANELLSDPTRLVIDPIVGLAELMNGIAENGPIETLGRFASEIERNPGGFLGRALVDLAAAKGLTLAAGAAVRLIVPNWSNWRSRPTFGHTFDTHGAGSRNTRNLRGRAGGTGESQGQWLNNEAAADFLRQERPGLTGPKIVDLQAGVEGQVIKPDGTIVPATRAQLVPNPSGGYTTAYPIE